MPYLLFSWLRARRKAVTAALTALAVIALWLLFAPTRFGGGADYVIVNGSSMEPVFHQGDLVLVRQARDFDIGDIVIYRHPEVGPVIHRIIGQDLVHFTLKGDNNDLTDSYQPTAGEILGAYWLHIPGLGAVFAWMRSPWALAGFVLLSGLLIGMTTLEKPEPKRRRNLRRRLAQAAESASPLIARRLDAWLAGLFLLLLLSLALGAVAFSRPLLVQAPDDIPYTLSGTYAYSGTTRGGVYDDDRFESGEPIFPALTCTADLTFEFIFHTDADHQVGGTYQLQALVASETGWTRQVSLLPPDQFDSDGFRAGMQLDVCQVSEMIDALQQKTGAESYQYFLRVYPNISLSGGVAGRSLATTFSPPLNFIVVRNEVYLRPPAEGEGDPLRPLEARTLPGFTSVPNTLNLFSFELPVLAARWLAALGALLAAGGLALVFWSMNRARAGGEQSVAQWTLGDRLVQARGRILRRGDQVVDLASLEDLARLADRLGEPVFFQQEGDTATYLVRDQGLVYRFERDALPPAPPASDDDIDEPASPPEPDRMED